MVATARCPDRSQLERFLCADLPDDDASGIDCHLAQCDSCASSIHEISSEDPLIKALRGGPSDPIEGRVDTLAEGFCRALPGLLAPGPGPGTTDLAPAPRAPDGTGMGVTEEVFDFLAPPEGPGEIGRLGPYRVTGPIGAGGMGIVFGAEDPLLGRPVALKVMKRSLSAGEAARRRFLREAQAIAALEHDHVVAIYQAGEDRGVLFLAMPLLQGETLAARLRREGVLPLPEALRVAREVAEGLDAAHRRGLVHRDIKPANLWLEGGRGRVKILDFGLSRSLEPEADPSQSSQIAGTPHYMSPEQARGSSITPLCDLFSLGCVLYHMTTGRVPFDGPDTLAVLTALAVATPEPPDRLNPGLPPVASALITSLLARDPSARPESARAVVEAIEAIERAPSPAATPRPRRPAIGLALLVVLGLSGAGAAFGPQVVRIFTDKGQLVVETSDPGVRVEVKRGGQLVTIVDHASGRRVDLHAGEYDLELSEGKDGLRLSTRRFALTRGGREVVRVTMEPMAAPPAKQAHAAPPVADSRGEIDRLTARLRDRPDDPAALQARADAYAKAGDHDLALADWDHAIAIEPTEFRVQARGWVYFSKRDLDRALADFREAIRLDPKAPAPHMASATIHRFRGDLELARSEYNEAIRLDPTSATAFLGRGLFLLDRRDLGRALADLDEAIRLDPRGVNLWPHSDALIARSETRRRQGDLEGALADADEAIRLEPDRAANYRIRSEVALARRDYRAELVDLDRAYRLDPNDAFTLAARCTARYELGDLDGALADGEASIRLNPDFPWAYHIRGLVRAARGEDDLAIADLTESLRRDPSLALSLTHRAGLYERRGEPARARADRDEADRLVKSAAKERATAPAGAGAEIDRLTARLRDRPGDPAALQARAEAYVKAGDAGRAIADFDEAIRRDPADAAAYEGRAHARQLTADHLGAIADSDSALRLDPGLATAYAIRGAALTSLGEWGRGRVALDEFIRRVPREPWSYYHRGLCRQSLGDLDGAVADFNLAIELDPEIPRFYGQRGLALAMRHDLGRALEDVERALRSTPNNREFLRLRGWVRAQRGEYGGALADYDRAFEGRPLDATKLADRASVRALAGHYKEAEADFEAALRAEPSNPWIRARRALYLRAARGDHTRAVADCDEALQLSPGHAEASLNRGLSSLALHDFRRAIADFDRALDPSQGRGITFLGPLSFRYPELYRARSEAHRRLGDLDGAVADLDAALGLDPDDAEARVRRGRLHASRRDFARAIADFDRAIALGRRDADLYRDRGDAVDRLSKPAAK